MFRNQKINNVGLVLSYLGLKDAIQRKVISFCGIVVGSENRAKTGAPRSAIKTVPIVIYDIRYDRNRRRQQWARH